MRWSLYNAAYLRRIGPVRIGSSGRLIRKYVPLNTTDFQTEDHYYDGVRRIQTIGYRFEDPNGPGFGTGGGTFGEGEGGLQAIELEPIPLPPVETAWTQRQYVYGPGYVDEFVAEVMRRPGGAGYGTVRES